MKKISVFLILIVLIILGFFTYKKIFGGIPKLEVEEEKVDIDEIFNF